MGRSAATTSHLGLYDAAKNPALARVAADDSLPSYEEGREFHVVCHEGGSTRADIPIFATKPGAVVWDPLSDRVPVSRTDASGVPGGFVLGNVCTPRECDQIIKLSETFGYTEDAPVSLARNVRQNENCVWIADQDICSTLFERCRQLLPPEVLGGAPCGLNARWRLYKYNPSDVFRMHTDGSWPGSGLDESGALVRDVYGDRWSQLTFVLYLNDDFSGGGTRFFYPVPGKERRFPDECQVQEVKAQRGAALCFFHGEHPLSPLHEGGLVTGGTKYIVRSDVLYMLPRQRL